ncbi:MAG TPA: ABC transporter permease [Streptosporangiaceae bacterium]|jgi:peptide/nickel transport system permease protein
MSGSGSRSGVVARRAVRNVPAVAGAVVLVLLFLLAFLGPYLTKWGYQDKDFTAFRQPPSPRHWFGTGDAGQDVFATTVRGMQKSLIIGLLVAVVSTGLAGVVGAFAGYFLGAVDRVLMWVVDLLLVLPSFLMVAILSPLFRGATWLLFAALLAAFMWMVTARIIRGMTMSLREREYVLAARYMGVPPVRIVFRHILPNVSSLLIVDATINVSAAVMAESALSYFGFGVQPPDVSLGTLLADASTQATTYPWLFLFPAALLVLIVLSVNLIGDGLRDALDPASGKAAR